MEGRWKQEEQMEKNLTGTEGMPSNKHSARCDIQVPEKTGYLVTSDIKSTIPIPSTSPPPSPRTPGISPLLMY